MQKLLKNKKKIDEKNGQVSVIFKTMGTKIPPERDE